MEYALIFILQLLGIACHVGQTVIELDKLSPDDTMGDVFKLFLKKDRFTLLFSVIIIAFNVTVHFIIETYAHDWMMSVQYFHFISFGLAFVFGYGGQAILLAVLGKSVDFIKQKALDKLN